MGDAHYFGDGLTYLNPSDLKGKLIAIEGTDGVGRSTHIELLQEWLEVQGYGVITTGWTRSNLMSKTIEVAKEGNTIEVEPSPCPPEWDQPYCPPGVIEEGGNCYGGDGVCPPNQQTYITSEGASLCTPAVAWKRMFFSRLLIASTAGSCFWSMARRSSSPPTCVR